MRILLSVLSDHLMYLLFWQVVALFCFYGGLYVAKCQRRRNGTELELGPAMAGGIAAGIVLILSSILGPSMWAFNLWLTMHPQEYLWPLGDILLYVTAPLILQGVLILQITSSKRLNLKFV